MPTPKTQKRPELKVARSLRDALAERDDGIAQIVVPPGELWTLVGRRSRRSPPLFSRVLAGGPDGLSISEVNGIAARWLFQALPEGLGVKGLIFAFNDKTRIATVYPDGLPKAAKTRVH
jgi:hypothetical protein